MASVDQHESPAATFMNGLDVYNTYKSTRPEEEADSDEESFHLPLLDSDEENRVMSIEETENEILNKFDTGPADEDDKCDESILNEKDDEEQKEKNEKQCKTERDRKEKVEVINTGTNSAVINADVDSHHGSADSDKVEETEKQETKESDLEKIEDNVEKNERSDKTVENDERPDKADEIEEKSNNCKENIQEAAKLDIKSSGAEDRSENITDSISPKVSENKENDLDNVPVEKYDTSNESSVKSPEPTRENLSNENKSDENCEIDNSSEDAKDKNLECEDLLNISVIRDADEDNAEAIAEQNNDILASNKSNNDNDDQDEEKTEVEDSEEMDQDENVNSSDKDENMEFEEDENSSNFCDQETTTNDESTNDATINKEFDADSRSASKDTDACVTTAPKDDVPGEGASSTEKALLKNDDNDAKEKNVEPEPVQQNKRPLDENDEKSTNKKIRLSLDQLPTEVIIDSLTNFREFMQSKKGKGKLTRSEMEQFVLQKICEAMMHKHQLGEMLQARKRHEQTIENLKKDIEQLTKQGRDLDIVNKKLMNELRFQNGIKRPLVPLKITRSVGLQVRIPVANEVNIRRKSQSNANLPRTPIQNGGVLQRPRPIAPANNSVVRKVITSPRKPQTPSPQQKPTTPILSQALQQTRPSPPAGLIKRAPVRQKQQSQEATPRKPSNPGVIDLTDEDDKAAKAAHPKVVSKSFPQKTIMTQSKPVSAKSFNVQTKSVSVGQAKTAGAQQKTGTPIRTVTTTTLPQGVRLTPTQVKNGIAIPTTVMTSTSGGSTAQVMYVVQPSTMVTSMANGNPKTLLLNFQPTNGVLTSTLNGSAVSVISKQGNSVLRPVQPRKHPAPLPLPPPVPVNPSLKPLLPKPVLSIRKTETGIILQWRMPYNLDLYESIGSYQLFAYQETTAPPSTEMWRKVGDVKALALPMACTLTQFADKNKYYFAVRSMDVHKRLGAFSDPEEISL